MTLDSYISWKSTAFLIQNMVPKTLRRLVVWLRSTQQPETPTRQWTNAREKIKPEGYTYSHMQRMIDNFIIFKPDPQYFAVCTAATTLPTTGDTNIPDNQKRQYSKNPLQTHNIRTYLVLKHVIQQARL